MERKSNEIDVIGIIKKVLKEWRLLMRFIIVFAIIGVVVALNKPKVYTTTVILAPEYSGGSALPEGLSSIASMVGVNIGGALKGGVDAIYPQIYPDVLTSSDFIIKLFDVKVQQEEDTTTKTYYRHLVEDVKIPFWNYPMIFLSEMFKDEQVEKGNAVNPFKLTKEQTNVLNTVRANVACTVDKNTSVISISVNDFDRNVSAIMAETIQKQLQEYITVYRTQKARNDMEYTEKLYKESKKDYVRAQQKYTSYADANEDLLLESFKAKRDELENEMQLRYNIYNQIAQQLQLAKAKVQEQTPVFSVIQGASIPIKASSLPRSFIVLLYIFCGILLDALWITFFRNFFAKRKLNRSNN